MHTVCSTVHVILLQYCAVSVATVVEAVQYQSNSSIFGHVQSCGTVAVKGNGALPLHHVLHICNALLVMYMYLEETLQNTCALSTNTLSTIMCSD